MDLPETPLLASGCDVPFIAAQLLQTDELRSFWDFVTTVRRTHSLSDRKSASLRGQWLTPSLAVQQIHGWGRSSVRLLCVHAPDEVRRGRLLAFFARDRMNMDGRLVRAADPLDAEPRVLVKLPFGSSLDGWVEHEARVLSDLQDLDGIPRLHGVLRFEDVGVRAAAYSFDEGQALQAQLEGGNMVPEEGIHKLASFMLRTLGRAHDRGWLHTDLQPKDVILPRSTDIVGVRTGLLTGWTRAVQRSPALEAAASLGVEGGLLEFVQGLAPSAPDAAAINADASEPDDSREAGSVSVYSAPEQFAGIFAGASLETAATDVYRAAAMVIVAVRAAGPLGESTRPLARRVERPVQSMRRLCQESLLRRAEFGNTEAARPPAPAVQAFACSLEELLKARMGFIPTGEQAPCREPYVQLPLELGPWFAQALCREPSGRFQSTEAALDDLDSAWSALELRRLEERRRAQAIEPPKPAPRERIVFEPPPELESMTVL